MPSPLLEKYSENFTPETLAAAEELFRQHHCAIITAAPDALTAEVTDAGDLYEARWHVAANRLIASCDCPHFTSHHALCPHLGAALLAADASSDLAFALKRNIARRIIIPVDAASAAPSTPDDSDLTYQPLTRTPRRTSAPAAPASRELTYDREPNAFPAGRRPTPRPATARALPPQQVTYLFILHLQKQRPDQLTFDLAWRPFAPQGTPPPPAHTYHAAPDVPPDSPALAFLLDSQSAFTSPAATFALPLTRVREFLDLLDDRNLLRWRSDDETPPRVHALSPLLLPGIRFQTQFTPAPGSFWLLNAALTLPDGPLPLQNLLYLWPNGLALSRQQLILADLNGQADLARSLVGIPPKTYPLPAARSLARTLVLEHACTPDDLPANLRPAVVSTAPQGRLFVKTALYKYQGREMLHADLSFNYNGTFVSYGTTDDTVQADRSEELIHRDAAAEDALTLKLEQLGFRWNDNKAAEEIGWKLPPAALDNAVRELVTDNWFVSAQGKNYRKPTTKTAVIVSRIDWFELHGSVTFDGFTVPLPELLEARNQGRNAVRLDDGTFGLLPLEWLENFTALTELGEHASDKIRFRQQQAAVVAALIADTETQFDQTFSDRLHALDTLQTTPALPPPTFQATLRPYQQEGLGWLLAMHQRGLGACLADDMGLGKTVQILAFLDTRHAAAPGRPSLVVMPKSLIFNWQAEAAKFAPHLSVIVYTGSARQHILRLLPQTDIVLTTYGTLRNDATTLAKIPFDCCILDESQNIKNADSATAEACRAIHADYRIAMTGTPIENKLAELFSQLDFLNPGLLGKLLKDDPVTSAHLPRETFLKIRHAVRIFVLRRTKQMVARNLPPKTEQILWVELDEPHQAEYNALRDFYRKQLSEKNDATSSFDALAALMKLRQAACHPALVFQNHAHDTSAKLELLAEKLTDLTAEGHKVLVFSQFTSLLRLVADKLLELNLTYVYLDGQTQDRQATVSQFQSDDDVKIFLISLKAGGVGLNLTAADYIFILDPWWNPATEAQAIDRAYRIGQTRPVFAYKLITRNTIEEKVLQMQNSKRKLASAYLKDSTELPSLSPDDIRFLLS